MTALGGRPDEVRRDRLRLVGTVGANKAMAGELSRLVRRAYDDVRVPAAVKEGASAVSYPFDVRMAAAAVRYHRTCARVLWELFRSPAKRLEPLYVDLGQAVSKDSRSWLWDGAKISVRAFGVDDFAAGERQVVGTVKNALIDGARGRGVHLSVDAEYPDLIFDVRMVDNCISVSLDLAGRPMHQRGYRQASGVAPLREDLAALLVMLTRHDSRSEVLLDPMGGSGTVAIEAASLARARYNWCSGRAPLCGNLPIFREQFAAKAKLLFADTQPLVMANEADADTFKIAVRNVETAGVAADCELTLGDFRRITREGVAQLAGRRGLSTERGVIISNPPYGERLQPAHLEHLYGDLRTFCDQFRGWRAGFLVANPEFERVFGLRAKSKWPLRNGPLRATFYLYEL